MSFKFPMIARWFPYGSQFQIPDADIGHCESIEQAGNSFKLRFQTRSPVIETCLCFSDDCEVIYLRQQIPDPRHRYRPRRINQAEYHVLYSKQFPLFNCLNPKENRLICWIVWPTSLSSTVNLKRDCQLETLLLIWQNISKNRTILELRCDCWSNDC